ncbi:MAG: hypothetical protein ORN28_00735 [Rhodoferax sp.]|nr:hypothetical protein [Rhodoferax sp.]
METWLYRAVMAKTVSISGLLVTVPPVLVTALGSQQDLELAPAALGAACTAASAPNGQHNGSTEMFWWRRCPPGVSE